MINYLLRIIKPIAEIIILWFVFYRILLFFKGTRAVQVLKGIVFLMFAFFVVQKLNLNVLNWIFTKLFALSVIAILIIFQPELRRGLARLGQKHIFGIFLKEEQIIDEVAKSAMFLSKRKIGALIAIEREMGLRTYIESGVRLDSRVSSELINTIFSPNSPLHDGGIIIAEGKIVAAGCLFPLTENPHLSKTLGTRHRAAIGLSEETDSLVVAVSEESQRISLAVGGKLTGDLDMESLAEMLRSLFRPKAMAETRQS